MATSSTRPAVLIVDDEWLLRALVRDFVEDAGFEAFEAADAEEALRVLAANPQIGGLFTDINMPGERDGLQLAHEVHERRPDIRLLITSGKSLTGKLIPAYAIFLPKPSSSDLIVQYLSSPPFPSPTERVDRA